MKKTLLLTVGALLFLLPGSGQAFELEPLSPAVSQVLERTQDIVDEAAFSGELAAFFEDEMFPEWEQEFLSTVFQPIDTEQHVVIQRESLLQDTACFRYDQFVIDRALAYVRQLIEAAEERHDIMAIFRLGDAHRFLTDAQKGLLKGALHPGVEYDAWRAPLLHETEEETESLKDLCFYNSNYAPASTGILEEPEDDDAEAQPVVDGYGCDREMLTLILERIPADAAPLRGSVEEELRMMTLAQNAATVKVRTAEHLRALQETVDELIDGNTPAPPPAPPERVHQEEYGCREAADPDVVLQALDGRFSLDPDDAQLTFEYREQQLRRDAERRLPDEFLGDEGDSPLQNLDTLELQQRLREFTARQTALESATFAAAVDPGLAAEDVFSGLRMSVDALVRLGNSMDEGLRGFVRDFAYFLLRSCGGRPCALRLERVLKLNFTDECFAYGNGEYLKATPDNPQWRQCLCAADPEADECEL